MTRLSITRRSLLRSMGGLIGASLLPSLLVKTRDARADQRVIREINIKGYNRALLPRGHGQLIKLIRPMTRRYPSRDHCMQMMVFFSGSSGLLVQTKDPQGYISDWEIIPGDKLRIHFYGPEPKIETTPIRPTIEAAAEHYRSWAIQQTWAKKKDTGVEKLSLIAVAPNKNFKQQTQSITELYEKFSSPIGAWPTQWRKHAFDTMYPDYTPNDPNAFAAFLSDLKNLRCITLPYINGFLWDDRFNGFNGFTLEDVEAAAFRKKDGGFLSYSKTLPHLKYACPASGTWQNIIIAARNSLRDSKGMISSGVYLDMVAAAGPPYPYFCFASNHGHAPGDPLAWQNGVRKMLSSIDGIIMSEGNAEIYIDEVDALLMHLYTDGPDGYIDGPDGIVPLWKMVYGDLSTSVGWQMPPTPTPEQLEAELARANNFGVACNGSPWMTHVIQEALLKPEFHRVLKSLPR